MGSLVLGAAGAVIGGLIGGPTGAEVGWMLGSAAGNYLDPPKNPARMTDLKVQASTTGQGIPIAMGKSVRMTGNLIWSIPITEHDHGAKGGPSGSAQYTYTGNYAIALCEGPIAGIGRVWANGKLVHLPSGSVLQSMQGTIFGGLVDQTLSNQLGEDIKLNGSYTVYNGTEDQQPDGYIQSIVGSTAPGYRGLAYVVIRDFELADYGNTTPNFEFEVFTFTNTVGDAVSTLCQRVGLQSADIDTSQLTDPLQGFAKANLSSARSVIEVLASAYFFDAVESNYQIRFVKRGNAIAATIPEDDLAAHPGGATMPDQLLSVRTADMELPAEQAVLYFDPTINYQQNVQYSRRRVKPGSNNPQSSSLPLVLLASKARWIADLSLFTSWISRTNYQFCVSRKWTHLEPTDVVYVVRNGVRRQMRLVKKTEQKPGLIQWDAIAEDVDAYSLAEVAGPNKPIAIQTDRTIDPGNINPPVIVQGPMDLCPTGLEIWIAGSGGPNWRGAHVWVSTDNVNFSPVGELLACQMGVLSGPLGAAVDPDTTSTLAVDLTESRGTLYSVSQASADAGETLCYVDGEFISYENATLTATSQYDLTYLRRGLHGTTSQQHASGTPFARMDGNVFKYPFNKKDAGTTLYFKFPSFNIYGAGGQDLGSVPTYTYTIQGPATTVNPPGNFTFAQGDFDITGHAVLSYTASDSINTKEYQLEYMPVGGSVWTVLAKTAALKQTIPLNVGDYQFRVKAINALDYESAYVYVNGSITIAPVPNITGLELFNAGLGTTFTGKDVKITWRASAAQNSYDLGSEAYGANSGAVDPYFRDYEVRVLDMAGNVLRVEHTGDNWYTYDWERNLQDGGPRRAVQLEVFERGLQNQLSAVPALLQVANPQAGQLQSINIVPRIGGFDVSWVYDGEPDLAGARVWMSQTQGFTPDDSTLVYGGPDSKVSLKAAPGVAYYFRFAQYDAFGLDSLALSSEFTATCPYVSAADLQAQIIGESLLTPELGSRINLIDGPASLPGSVAAQVKTESDARTGADNALSSRIDTVSATASNTAASLITEQQARADGDSANATSISQVSSRLNNFNGSGSTAEAVVQQETTTRASQTGQLLAQYTVKLSVNGIGAGFGLASDGTVGGSEFMLQADKVSFILPNQVKTVSSLTASGTTATASCANHGYSNGAQVYISGATDKLYNGLKTITVVDANTFTYALAAAPAASPATALSGVTLSCMLWQSTFVSGLVNGVPTAVMNSAFIGDATINSAMIGGAAIKDNHIDVSGISASKIKTGVLSADTQVTVGSNLVLSGDGSITSYAPGTPGQQDYSKLNSGNLVLYRYIAALGQTVQYNYLSRTESGQVNNNTLVTIPGYWKQQPKVMVSPASIQSFNVSYANQSQTLQCQAQNLVENPVGSGQYQFTALAQLILASGQATGSPTTDTGSVSGDDNYLGSQSSPFTTPANTTSINLTVAVSSVRGTGTAPNFYYRSYKWQVWYYNNGWVSSGWLATQAIGQTTAKVNSSATFTFPSAGAWQYYIEVQTFDTDGTTWSNGGSSYNYSQTTMGPIAGPSATSTANYPSLNTTPVTDAPGNTVSLALGSYTVPPGWSIYQVDYSWSWSLTSAYQHDSSGMRNCNAGKLKVSPGNTSKTYVGTTIAGGTQYTTSGNDSYSDTSGSYNANINAVAESSEVYDSTMNYWAQSYASGEISNGKAIIYIRQPITNSTTPANDAGFSSWTATLASTTVLASGSLNWQAVGQ